METSYLKAHPLEDRYPEWTPNLHSDRSLQDWNQCAEKGHDVDGDCLSSILFSKSLNNYGDFFSVRNGGGCETSK